MQINYIREAIPGDNVVFYTDISDIDLGYIEGIKKKGGGFPIFKIVLEIFWGKKRGEILYNRSYVRTPN